MKKALSFALAAVLLLLFAACDEAPPAVSLPLPSSAVSTPPASAAQPPAAVPAPGAAFLTGLPKGPDYPKDRRITAVMVNNYAASRPTRGLSAAKILYEIKVEGGITRFMALYEDYAAMPEVGGVRSSRDQFFQLLLPYWGFYVAEGPNEEGAPVNQMMAYYTYGEFKLQSASGAVYWIDRPGFTQKEYMAYTDAERISEALENTGADDYRSYGSPIFNFLPQEEAPRVPAAGAAAEVAVLHSHNYRTLFEYDGQAVQYKMSMFSDYSGQVEPTLDENTGGQLGFDNLLVVFAPMELYDDSEQVRVRYDVGGVGYYFTRGHYEPFFWSKDGANHPMLFYSWENREEMIEINPGTSYVAVVDDAQLRDFDAVLRSGTAGQAASEGELDPEQEDVPD